MTRFARLGPIVVCAIVGVCCVLPLGWMAAQIVADPAAMVEMKLSGYRLALLGRTLLYNGGVALLATVMAIPAALVIGRRRGWTARLLLVALPAALLIPSITYTYGWAQAFRLLQLSPYPAGAADVLRCVWTLACWLWALPAVGLGLAIRFSDTQVQQQALLDGALGRVMVRLLIGPALACFGATAALAIQEFAVYEPTGISVVATEVRAVFETGAFADQTPAITASAGSAPITQAHRAAASVATALPLLAVIGLLALLAIRGVGRVAIQEDLGPQSAPQCLQPGRWAVAAAWLTVLMTTGVPVAAMILSHARPFSPAMIWQTFLPGVLGSLAISAMSGTIALALALAACAWRSRLLLAASVTAFLVGGQILAIANIRLYNPYNWLYDSPAVVVISQVGRFAWLALLAAEVAWSRPVRELRQVAAVDGAGNAAATMHVVWPLVWPILAGGAVLVMLLSLTEVPATLLVRPLRPPVLVVQLMTWIHNLRDDNMIEGALLLLILAMTLAVVAITLIGVGLRIARPAWRRSAICVGVFAGLLAVGGCGKSSNEPEAILGGVGTGPGQFVYPRAIAYSPADNTMFVVDRMARVQHLDMDGRSLREWQMPQWQNGKPVGLSVGPDGNLYVPDTHYHRVMVYSADGKLIRQWGGRGTEPGQFIFPTDIAFDSSGFIYVGEYGDNDRIQVFDAQGRFIRQFGRFGDGPGEFSRPESLLIVGDLLYVTDACNHRIQVFRTDGSFVRSMGSVGSDLGQFRFPYGLDKDSRGRLVVAEFGNNRVQLIDPQTGKGLATWGRPGRAPGELAYPWAVTVDRNDRVFVVDSGNDRIQVFGF